MRIATYNMWGRFGDPDTRLDILADHWLALDIDVLFAQEVPDEARAAAIAARLGYDHYATAHTGTECVMIAARTPLDAVLAVPLSASTPARTALVAATEGVQLVCAHTAFRPAPVVEAHVAEVCALAVSPTVVGGDLNAEPALVRPVAARAGLEDSLPGLTATWPTDADGFRAAWSAHTGRRVDFPVVPRRLDYLLTRDCYVPAAGHRIISDARGMASDHALIWADVFPGAR